ncbi:MAG: 4-hydroxythreonine-4-phosphate dehydrogenase PdxA [Muribaculaceae bacterium]|nr:4-hydroxythreonine-4-phosphate dehydrogenase PdxA [Muribaculaceae bacterium]
MMDKIKVAITQGDTNGIGLEVVLKAINDEHITELFTPVVFANHHAFRHALAMIGEEKLPLNYIDTPSDALEGRINIVNVGNSPVTPVYGEGTPVSGTAAVESLVAACNSLDDEETDVLVTAPIDKGAAQVDGFNFVGHTEFLEERFGDEEHHARMLLFNDELRVMLQTTHLPISGIAQHITREWVLDSIRVLNKTLVESFEIERPRIAVLSLNPHNGDHGLLGREEIDEISPAIEEAREEGILAFGPYAADGFFGSDNRRAFDGILAMYHDQGLAPFKALARQSGVNYTANLSVVRTSPDHGTAFDIAGRNEADGTSMREAIYRAIDIYRARRRYEEMSLNPLKKYKESKSDSAGAQ